MAREYPSVLDLVGSTPIVRLDRLSADVPGTILAKLEYLNPGGSVKDRIGLAMIEAAERDGLLKPGGTIVEPTSGNTGVGLAIAAAIKGYRCIFVMPDKMSNEKIAMLRAYGAEVVITPTAVEHDSPESYYSVSSRLAEEIPGGFKPDQYSNMANPRGALPDDRAGDLGADRRRDRRARDLGRHRRHDQRHRALLQGAQPGGADRRRRSRGLDLHGRGRGRPAPVLRRGNRQGLLARDDGPEGGRRVGARLRPRLVPDRAAARARGRAARGRLVRHDRRGRRSSRGAARARSADPGDAARLGPSYLSKFLDDKWMLEHGFLERSAPAPTVAELLRAKGVEESDVPALVTISAHQKVGEAIDAMQRYSISQLPVVRDGGSARWPT